MQFNKKNQLIFHLEINLIFCLDIISLRHIWLMIELTRKLSMKLVQKVNIDTLIHEQKQIHYCMASYKKILDNEFIDTIQRKQEAI